MQQLATGASLRFALPVAALGLLWIVSFMRRTATFVSAAAAVGVITGVRAQWQLFSSDSTTHDVVTIAIVAALIAATLFLVRDRRFRTAAAAILLVCLGAFAGGLARSHPADYVAATYGGAFSYAASEHFERVVTLGLPAGAAITVDPNVRAFDAVDAGVCAEAQTLDAVIVTSTARLRTINCGRVLYQDAGTAVIDLGAPSTIPPRSD